MTKRVADEGSTATPAPEPRAEPASETQASVRATDDTFDSWMPGTWPDGMRAFLKNSNAPSTDDAAEAYQTWRQLQIENERNALLRSIAEKLSMPGVPERDALAPAPPVASASLHPQAESATMPVLIDAPEAARLMGINVKALYKRVSQHQVPRAALYRTGTPGKRQRLQFVREELVKPRRPR